MWTASIGCCLPDTESFFESALPDPVPPMLHSAAVFAPLDAQVSQAEYEVVETLPELPEDAVAREDKDRATDL